jgi:hypothetical protein
MPISYNCIPNQEDLNKWPHLRDLDFQEVEDKEVMLLIGLKERPGLFIPLECKAREETEPIAIRYSLGWVVMGPTGGEKDNKNHSVNFVRMVDDHESRRGPVKSQRRDSVENRMVGPRELKNTTKDKRCLSNQLRETNKRESCTADDKEMERQVQNEHLQHQLER